MVKCLECNREDLKSLGTHLKMVHNLSVTEYKEKHNTEDLGYTIGAAKAGGFGRFGLDPANRKGSHPKSTNHPNDIYSQGFTALEKKYFNDRIERLYKSAQEDPDIEATVRDVAYNEVLIMRYQRQLATEKDLGTKEVLDLTKICDTLQKQNAAALKDMNLTLGKKQELNKSPETTPSRIITAYAMAKSRMTERERVVWEKQVAEAFTRLENNKNELKNLIPTVGYDTDNEEADIDG